MGIESTSVRSQASFLVIRETRSPHLYGHCMGHCDTRDTITKTVTRLRAARPSFGPSGAGSGSGSGGRCTHCIKAVYAAHAQVLLKSRRPIAYLDRAQHTDMYGTACAVRALISSKCAACERGTSVERTTYELKYVRAAQGRGLPADRALLCAFCGAGGGGCSRSRSPECARRFRPITHPCSADVFRSSLFATTGRTCTINENTAKTPATGTATAVERQRCAGGARPRTPRTPSYGLTSGVL